ncbi:MAG: lytic transglycosylase domain-containing protein [Bacteroidales bacterium]|nr:lytic transglycosylase domain-containing protein [Bacteroidales bacterium]
MVKNILITVLLTLLLTTLFWMWYYQPEGATINMSSLNIQLDEKTKPSNTMVKSIDLPDTLSFAGHEVPLELFYVRESLERELIVNTYWHSSTLLLLKRANRWFPVIEPILAQHNIPNDFKYLCMIESNLTNARSPAGAVGFWQFLEGTAKDYGLEVNKDVDERYHVEKSTLAACFYLNKSYARFNNWALVAASYNAGQKRINGFLENQLANSYFDLHMAEETDRYLHRMLAMKLIYSDPEKYGFFPDIEKLYAPLEFSTVVVNDDIKNLAEFAAENRISYKLLKYFNPWLRSNKLPVRRGDAYTIKVPTGRFAKTHAIYKQSESISDTIFFEE